MGYFYFFVGWAPVLFRLLYYFQAFALKAPPPPCFAHTLLPQIAPTPLWTLPGVNEVSQR